MDLTQKSKASFSKIRKLIERMDHVAGLFLLKDSLENFSKEEKFFKASLPVQVVLATFMAFSTLMISKLTLISIIIVCSITTTLVVFYLSFVNFVSNKNILRKLLYWCDGLYNIDGNFNDVVYKVTQARLIPIQKLTYRVVMGAQILIYNNSLMITLGFAIIGLFLPENIYPKFSPPIPFYLPFENQKTWTAFITTVLVQTIIANHISIMSVYVLGFFYCVSIHILGFLDIISDIIKKIKKDMIIQLNNFDDQPSTSKQQSFSLKSEVLTNINKGFVEMSKPSFSHWIPILTDMINDVNDVISSLNELYKGFFLQFEACNFGALFITGLIFTVVKQQYFFSFISLEVILLYSICYIHEQILDKLEDIKLGFYDLPWYAMDSKQRKMLLLVMNCDKIQDGFTASKLHTMTIERFGLVIKAGYTNLLVLKDLVMK